MKGKYPKLNVMFKFVLVEAGFVHSWSLKIWTLTSNLGHSLVEYGQSRRSVSVHVVSLTVLISVQLYVHVVRTTYVLSCPDRFLSCCTVMLQAPCQAARRTLTLVMKNCLGCRGFPTRYNLSMSFF